MKPINLDSLRREARELKKLKGIQHSAALDLVAKAHGYDKWTDLVASQNDLERSDKRRSARTPRSQRLTRHEHRSFEDQPPEGAHLNPYESPSLVKRILRP